MVLGGRLHQGKKAIAGEGAGPLGARYDPFRVECDAEQGTHIPALQLPENLTPERLHDRQALLRALDETRQGFETGGRSIEDYRAQALTILTSPGAPRLFYPSHVRPSFADPSG